MVKPPIVYTRRAAAGIRARRSTPRPGRGSARTAGQQLFFPPNVAGWNDDRWLDTASYLARWDIAGRVLSAPVLEGEDKAPTDAEKLARPGAPFWGHPA